MPGIPFNDFNNKYEPAPAWRYFFEWPAIDNLTIDSALIKNADLPIPTIDTDTTYVAGKNLYFPRDMSIDQFSITFQETHDFRCFRYLDAWRKQVLDDDGNYGVPDTYWRTIKAQLLDTVGNANFTLEYRGCIPVQPASYHIDSESSTFLLTTINITVNKIQMQFGASS